MDVHINGIRLHTREYGQGAAVLLIHAFPLSGAMWQPQVEALADDYRLIVPDLRGFGNSEVPPGPYAMETLAEDLAALLDVLGVPQVGIVGLSMGGYVALALLRRYPQRVRALVLCDTRATPDTDEARAGRELNAQLAETQGASAIAEKMLPNLLAPGAAPELRAHLRQIIERNQPQGIAGALRGMAMRPDSAELLPHLSIPVLLLVGAQDSLSPPAEMRTLQQAIPGSQLVEIPGAGHLANVENPAAFNAALGAFLGSIA